MKKHSCSLLEVPGGSMVQVENLCADPATRSHLYALGFVPGTQVEVCDGQRGSGCRRVKIRDTNMVLGENMAEHIVCCPPGAIGSPADQGMGE